MWVDTQGAAVRPQELGPRGGSAGPGVLGEPVAGAAWEGQAQAVSPPVWW